MLMGTLHPLSVIIQGIFISKLLQIIHLELYTYTTLSTLGLMLSENMAALKVVNATSTVRLHIHTINRETLFKYKNHR